VRKVASEEEKEEIERLAEKAVKVIRRSDDKYLDAAKFIGMFLHDLCDRHSEVLGILEYTKLMWTKAYIKLDLREATLITLKGRS